MSESEQNLQDPQERLPGDDLLADASGQLTHRVDIKARPDEIWPWLVQMGLGRGGYYGADWIDDDDTSSACEVHAELQDLAVGDVLAATPDGKEGFEVLRIDPLRALVMGHLHDHGADQQLPFAATRPALYWQATWALVLQPLDETSTRLLARSRFTYSSAEQFQEAWIHPVHRILHGLRLDELAARIEGRMPPGDGRDVIDGLKGAGLMLAALLTPFRRGHRARWGVDAEPAGRTYPGDELIAKPRWGWTHGVEIDAPAAQVWPWVAQVGADRGGFYSYQWLENVAGCKLRNAEAIHPEWEVREGDGLRLHPRMPPLQVEQVEPGRHFVARALADQAARAAGKAWVEATWLFLVEPLGERRCRFVSRYRVDCSNDLSTRLSFGPLLLEPIGFAMDRRMLLGVKERAERARRTAPALSSLSTSPPAP